MEIEYQNELRFLDVLIKGKEHDTLSYTVPRKPTHTDRYLNAAAHHDPA